MKKYRLKQWYPSLPVWMEEGDQVVQSTDPDANEYGISNFKEKPYNARVFSSEEVENNPEFWEEVQEPEYTDNDIDRAFMDSLVQGRYEKHLTVCVHVPTFKKALKNK